MTVEVLFFAATRDIVGLESKRVDLPAQPQTIADLVQGLSVLYPGLAGKLAGVRYALNEEFAPEDSVLSPGDTVAIIPPTAGG